MDQTHWEPAPVFRYKLRTLLAVGPAAEWLGFAEHNPAKCKHARPLGFEYKTQPPVAAEKHPNSEYDAIETP